MCKLSIIIYFSLFLGACTPYNNEKVNHSLLQGRWLLVDVAHPDYDSVEVDYSQERTYLLFEGDTCVQIMSDIGDTTRFYFNVGNYKINLYADSILRSSLDIEILTKDSLILSRNGNLYKYEKKE